jgi:predicted nucleotidyltransferase
MTQKDLIVKLKQIKHDLSTKFGIHDLALFGSYARGDFTPQSDVDLAIIQIDKKDYFLRAQAKYFIEKKLQKKVDIGYFDTIRPAIKKQIENEMIHV